MYFDFFFKEVCLHLDMRGEVFCVCLFQENGGLSILYTKERKPEGAEERERKNVV